MDDSGIRENRNADEIFNKFNNMVTGYKTTFLNNFLLFNGKNMITKLSIKQ